jgi:hypothetical protein
MLLNRPHPDPATTREPVRIRQRLEACLIARVQRDPHAGAQMTELALAVNVPALLRPGTGRGRAHHATFLLLLALDDAHQAFRLGCFPAVRQGALVRIDAAVLELMPFTHEYESIDHRLEARIRERRQLRLLQAPERPAHDDGKDAVHPATCTRDIAPGHDLASSARRGRR